ncbi:MAG: GGDEF domain-containing protein [Bdellovibrionales bacterium]|nr:GGDEF domain-containing protein [Bdellovibrionales bacterium]
MPNNTLPSQNNFTSNISSEELKIGLVKWVTKNSSLLEILIDAYCVVDLANNIVAVNTAFTVLCSESERKIRKNPQFNNFIKTEFCPGQCPTIQVITSEKSLRLDEVSATTKLSQDLKLTISGVPIFSDIHQLMGCLLTLRDVTAESKLQIKYDEKKSSAITDGLTHLYNKVFTEQCLIKLLKTSIRTKTPLTVMMGDIDHFKHVNDNFGHLAGDHVLSCVANILQETIRETDIAGRFGGEEFVVLLSNTPQAGALIFAERFREILESTQIFFEGKHIPITISLGTSTFISESVGQLNNPEEKGKQMIGECDMALYSSKANGRNKTTQFETIKIEKGIDPTTKK